MSEALRWWQPAHRLRTALPSDLPGAMFSAVIRVRRPADRALLAAVRRKAGLQAELFAVDRPDAAEDAIWMAVTTTFDISVSVRLKVDPSSAGLQQARLDLERQRRTHLEGLQQQLRFVREQILSDAATGRLWALLTFPEFAAQQGGRVIDQLLSSPTAESDHATAFLEWLTTTDQEGLSGLQSLSRVLTSCEQHDAVRSLQAFVGGSDQA
ncbi:hypothetical protein AB0P21_41005 [Kribbella sp. NPDC056861]|uniref:hypothetical protein n=1 Tax=Kribbella sp. NPDC056861 TaxID=3154857 RepID=UPI00343A1430